MKRNYLLFVEDIISAIKSIQSFVKGMSLEDLKNDDKTSSAVIRKLEVIGEAAKHVPQATRKKYAKVPWQRMAGMRDRLIHAYFGIDYALVWDVIKKELPALSENLRSVANELKKSGRKKA